jgi:hypothetical protein
MFYFLFDAFCDGFCDDQLLTVKLFCHLTLIALLEENIQRYDERNNKYDKSKQKYVSFQGISQDIPEPFTDVFIMAAFPVYLTAGIATRKTVEIVIYIIREKVF